MMLLIKESQHTGNNHGALFHISESFDYEGNSEGMQASFCGNVVCPDLEAYLAENPDVQVASDLPKGVTYAT